MPFRDDSRLRSSRQIRSCERSRVPFDAHYIIRLWLCTPVDLPEEEGKEGTFQMIATGRCCDLTSGLSFDQNLGSGEEAKKFQIKLSRTTPSFLKAKPNCFSPFDARCRPRSKKA